MEHLYWNGYLRTDKLRQALRYAHQKQRLPGVDKFVIERFMTGFEKVRLSMGSKYEKIDHVEMEKIFEILGRDHSDRLTDQQLQTISNVLLDEHFEYVVY